jgi:hypothetical protein
MDGFQDKMIAWYYHPILVVSSFGSPMFSPQPILDTGFVCKKDALQIL